MDLLSASLAVPGIVIAIASFAVSWNKASKESIVKQENRLTKIEENLFTAEDRKCLHELDANWKMFWGIIEKDFPRLLRHLHTPEFDRLLGTLEIKGLRGLTLDEAKKFDMLIAKEMQDAEISEDAGRGFMLILYKGLFDIANGEKKFGDSCQRTDE